MARPFLLLFLSMLAGCSSTATGRADHSDEDTTTTVQPADHAPGYGEACSCTSSYDEVPTQYCCAGNLVCRTLTAGETSFKCSQSANQCVRSGYCLDPPSSLPPTPPPSKTCSDMCDPSLEPGVCAAGYSCRLVGDCYACI